MHLSTLVILILAVFAAPASAHESGEEETAFQVTLIHGVPELVVDVEVGEGRRYKRVSIGAVLFLGAETDEDLRLTFKRPGTDQIVFETVADLSTEERKSLILRHDPDQGYVIRSFVNSPPALAAGASRLLIRNQGQEVLDVVLADGSLIMEEVPIGSEKSIDLPPGEFELVLKPSDRRAGSDSVAARIKLPEGDQMVVSLLGSFWEGSAAVAVEAVHDLEVDPSATAPTDLASAVAAAGSKSVPDWLQYVAAAVTAALLVIAAARYADRNAKVREQG